MKNKKLKTINCTIKPFENSFIGKKLVFSHHAYGQEVGTVIAVTNDRVIWVTEDGKENWTWRSPNGQSASFSVLKEDKNGKFNKALELEEYVKLLEVENRRLYEELSGLEKLKKLQKLLQDENGEVI